MRIVEDARLAHELLGDLLTDATSVLRASLLPVDFANPYLAPLIVAFARRYPGVGVDLDLTRRKVHLVSEPFDVASRIGQPADSNLIARPLATPRHAAPRALRCTGVEEPSLTAGDHHAAFLARPRGRAGLLPSAGAGLPIPATAPGA